ncbi:hypothetical protein [Halomonas icarae]|uniref:Zinc resistance-associated protein n=1 Tax=Halomonas icarae TaxID=2691040 RepID=A0A7X5AM67_9GAMM|nr:hypothetical protein [Halomonas icarae]MDR5901777.1 hypothetical protein [Halomonas icarae]NAW13125.1 hypothetical protein [Halomonas icarae]
MQTRRYRKMLAPALLAMAIAPLALQASAAPSDGERAESRQQWQEARAEDLQHRMRAMVDGWDLSDEERDELRELRQAHYAEMAELRDRDFDSREERREAYQELRDEHRSALAELLTDEQFEEMQQTARMAHGKRHGHGHGHGHHAGNDND